MIHGSRFELIKYLIKFVLDPNQIKNQPNLMSRVLIFLIGAFSFSLSGNKVFGQQKTPNVIIIMADDMGYGDLSCFGHPTIRTPHLDQMAAEGMRFTQFYSAANLCTPSRAGLMTGRLPIRSGMNSSPTKNNLYPTSVGGLPQSEITLAEALKTQKYATGMVGKWHLGVLPEQMPVNNGFDFYYGLPYSNDMFAKKGNKYPPLPMYRNNKIEEESPDQHLITQKYTVEVLNFIKTNKDKPFFLYYASNAPHTPLYASEKFEGKSKRGRYGDVVMELDWSVGEILKTLKELKLDKNTLVIFCSDNGPWMIQKEEGGSAGILWGGKGSTNEGGTRVPGIAWCPGTVPSNQVNETPVSAFDLFPTFVGLAGGKLSADRVYDGRNIYPLLTQKVVEKDHVIYYYTRDKLCAVRKGEWKLMFNNSEIYKNQTPAPPLIAPALYNLNQDPGERFNISKDHPKIVDELTRIYEGHVNQIKPVLNQLDRI
jgi:arylsulfatase A-like enzyme